MSGHTNTINLAVPRASENAQPSFHPLRPSCKRKACPWPVTFEGLCSHHARQENESRLFSGRDSIQIVADLQPVLAI